MRYFPRGLLPLKFFPKQRGLLSDREIFQAAPLVNMLDSQMKLRNPGLQQLPSCGLDSFGYDLRLSSLYRRPKGPIMRTTNECMGDLIDSKGAAILIEPNSFILGMTEESFDMPDDLYAIVEGKSSWARIGIAVHGCPVDPGYQGSYSLHIANLTPYPAQLDPGSGIARAIFFRGRKPRKGYSGIYKHAKDIPVTAHDVRLRGGQS